MFEEFEMLFFVLLLGAIALSLWASLRVNMVYRRYERQLSRSGMTGRDAARRMLDASGLSHVQVDMTPGRLTDHYDPRANVIRLSEATYNGRSTAAIGVAAHEAGHALQYAEGYAPIKVRTAIVRATQISSRAAIPLILAGILLSYLSNFFIALAYVGIVAFSLCVLFQLVTLPVEFNASSRALAELGRCDILGQDELQGSAKVLRAAALTYVAAMAVALLQLLRLIAMVSGSRRR
ncbi:MAG: zinc metallopeptidase [Eubacteriales bacterium]